MSGGEQVDTRAAIASAVVSMQLNPQMPTMTCRVTSHGPLSKLEFDRAGSPVLECVQCASAVPVSEHQVRLALGAAELPPSPMPVAAEFGASDIAMDAVPLRRGRLRVETALGSIHAVTGASIVVAIVVALKAAPLVGVGVALVVGFAAAAAADSSGWWVARRRNRGRAAWLPGHDVQVGELEPGTWIETPLNLRAPSPGVTPGVYAPKHATRVRGVTGVAHSPQTRYVALALTDGHVYTVRGDAPIRTLHIETPAGVGR